MNEIFITMKELAKILGVGVPQIEICLGHYSLTKYVTRRKIQTEKRLLKCNVFIICPESIAALYKYLKIKKAYSKNRNKMNLTRIYKLKKMYEEKSLE